MLDNFSSRLFVVISAAVVLFIVHSQAVKAIPTIRVKSNILRRLNGPDIQQTPLSAGLPSEGSGAQTATDAKGNFGDILSFKNHQSHPTPYTQGSFSFSQDNRWPRVRITKARSGGMKPASNIFTRSSLQGANGLNGWQNRKNDYSLQQKEEHTANSYNYLSQNWEPKYAKISSHRENVPSMESSRDSLKVDKDKSLGNSIYSNFFPRQTNKLQQAQPLTPTGHNGDYKETNQHPTVRVQSGWSERNKFVGFRSPAVPREATLGDRNPNQDTIPTVTDIPQKQISVGRGEKLGHRKVQPYLLKDSLTRANSLMSDGQAGRWKDAAKLNERSFNTQEKSKLDSDFKQLPRIDPTKQKSFDQKPSFPKRRIRIYSSQHTPTSPPQSQLYPASVKGKNLESFVPKVLLNSQGGSATSSKTFTSVGQINSTVGESVYKFKPQQSTGRISRLTNPVKQPSRPLEILNFQQSNLNTGINYRFKFNNMHSFLSPKYSFGQRVSTTATPAKLEKADSSSPTPEIQVASASEIVTAGFKPTRLQSESDGNSTEARFRLYKGSFGLKGLDSRPLEGARALPQGLDVSTLLKPDFEGFKRKSLQPWEPKRIRIHRQYNQARESEPSSSNFTTVSPNDLRGKEFELFPETPGSNRSTSMSTSYIKTPTFLIHQPNKNRILQVQSKTNEGYLEQNQTRSSDVVASSFLRSGRPKVPPKPESEPSQENKNKPLSIEKQTTVPKTSTSNTVRGKRVKQTNSRKLTGYTVFNATGNVAILRRPRVKAVTYADIVGSASFSSIKATSLTQVTLTNTTTTEPKEKWILNSEDGKNTSTNPEVNDKKDIKDFRNVEENEIGKDEETDEELKTPHLFFDNEGSGDVDLFDFLALLIKHQAAGKDLLELDYLRKSTGNMSFKSVRRSD